MNPFEVTPRARLDLFEVWSYIANDDIDAADRVVAEIEQEFQKLADMPGMGHTRADIKDPRYRFWTVYSYVIAYRPDTTPLQILRVVSGYRELGKLLP